MAWRAHDDDTRASFCCYKMRAFICSICHYALIEAAVYARRARAARIRLLLLLPCRFTLPIPFTLRLRRRCYADVSPLIAAMRRVMRQNTPSPPRLRAPHGYAYAAIRRAATTPAAPPRFASAADVHSHAMPCLPRWLMLPAVDIADACRRHAAMP